jgi:5-hydroxyisourate hydrolase
MTSLSTHVLDTELGKPAAGVRVTLSTPEQAIADAETGPDGRITDLGHGALREGTYRLVFDVADYLARQGRPTPFLRRVTIEFHVDDTQTHYHVPLLMTPFTCTAYRGS